MTTPTVFGRTKFGTSPFLGSASQTPASSVAGETVGFALFISRSRSVTMYANPTHTFPVFVETSRSFNLER